MDDKIYYLADFSAKGRKDVIKELSIRALSKFQNNK